MVGFRVLPLDWADLSSLSNDAKALLSMFSLAATDQNILHRCVAASQHPPSGRLEFDIPASLQRIFFLRIWLGKTFEIVESVEKIKRDSLLADVDLISVFSEIHANANVLKSHVAYEAALRLRNESSFHYGFKSMKASCNRMDPAANCNIHWGKRSVNSYFPLGEEVSFGCALDRLFADLKLEGDSRDLLENLTSWGLAGSKWVRSSHDTLISELLHKGVDSSECVEYSLEDIAPLVTSVGPHIPLFFTDPVRTP